MILKILAPTATFSGVDYNTRKVDRNKGELMKVANFGPLQAFGHLKPQDYTNYLSLVSSLNSNVRQPQFHAIISAKGRSYDKDTLTGIAENWLEEMGYGKQPYLIVFHKDTANNHVHLVSTRVDRNGEKINSAFEWRRGQQMLRRVLGYEYAMQYKFSTRAQFMMVLESRGFPGIDPDEEKIRKKIAAHVPDRNRISELKGLLTALKGQPNLAAHLRNGYQIELVFHAAEGKKAYGYTIIDHQEKQVFKGSEILSLRELIPPGEFEPDEKVEPADEKNEMPEVYIRPVAIADDVDDQQIHGMRRRRQRKARTNTR